ncbi:hypothetical protein CRI77_17500 [Mycolicibacterium duvalii]|uniref:Uncharacterized protein n=1 Tax=Mycolicibacterium duvalii TaxID=39688 RepID=A0A7I7K7U4_9MYCO|nr:hypothetical protein [Mycolicibacterium duvalii]MCV7366178.1 hypothetical protein [Mycolicibacterium duvalii]PEG38830.1 hypothetical protein CRI77_17500 [Mycolicibacterium duvalii]BBX19629.1 hypothetical protein MDUV_44890 [Mycolicibacterium duvalii]
MKRTPTAALAAAAAVGCCALAPAAQAQPDPAPGPPADPPKTSIEANGTYVVGTQIVPGFYQSAGPIEGGACYWKRTAGAETVDNALTKKPAIVHVEATDTTFTTSDCQTWQMTDTPPPPQPGPGELLGQLTQVIGSGMFNGGPR